MPEKLSETLDLWMQESLLADGPRSVATIHHNDLWRAKKAAEALEAENQRLRAELAAQATSSPEPPRAWDDPWEQAQATTATED